jgi:signal transduction histidine kinase/CRP-like cAMP-binding protein
MFHYMLDSKHFFLYFFLILIMQKKTNLYKKILQNQLFRKVPPELLEKIVRDLKIKRFTDGEVIFEDQSAGGELYLLIEGSVKVSKSKRSGEEIVIGIIKAGDCFGEISMVDRQSRSARIVAKGKCHTAVLSRKKFDYLYRQSPVFAVNILQTVVRRLRSANQIYLEHEEKNTAALHHQLTKTKHLVEISKRVNSTLDLDNLLEVILNTAAQTVGANRGTLYLLDEQKKELWSKVQKGSSIVEIRLPVGVGIAGAVAKSGKAVTITDAYADPRFNSQIDQTTGYRTRTVLCIPMKNREEKIIGVLQLLNKAGGPFDEEDKKFIEAFSVHAAIAVENAQFAQAMVQSERLSAVGRMASTIVHDIKSPMSTLRLSAQVLRKKTTEKAVNEFLDDMVQEIDRFLSMTQEILDYSRGLSVMNIQTVNFGETMESMVTYIEREVSRRNVQVERNLEFSGILKIDPDKLLRAFFNVAVNAVDAMGKGGLLRITTRRVNGWASVEFGDNGCGMSDEVKAKIFEPFFTYKKRYGTGLGMAIVKKIIDDHKGKIEVESRIGEGTTVKFFLPAEYPTP